jgi:hypothetical protein
MFWFSLQILRETFSLSETSARPNHKLHTGLHVQYLLFSSDFNHTRIFSKDFREILKCQSVEITNKLQPCNKIYYSDVYWRLNMFRAAHRSSSGALNCICSLWFTYTCGDRPLSSVIFPLRLDNGRLPHSYVNQRLQIQFRAPDDERCASWDMLSLQ